MPATIPPEREEIVRIAESYLGTPYRSGGTSARGVDCSGLVTAVYRSAGLDLPRTSKAQSQAGVRIAPDEIQPGDLVFFATSRSRSVSHVGIYIGNDRFIHASTKARSVCIDSLSLDYFKRRFVTARRVL
jgi:cell wall-associated NlpC family hydrolase